MWCPSLSVWISKYFRTYLHIGHDSVSTGVKIEERIGERLIIVCVKLQRGDVEGRLKGKQTSREEDASQELWEVCDKQEIQWRYIWHCLIFTPFLFPGDLIYFISRRRRERQHRKVQRWQLGRWRWKPTRHQVGCICICLSLYLCMSVSLSMTWGGHNLTGSVFRIKECRENDLIDSKYGFDRLTLGEKTAYLINMHACEVVLS